MRSVGDVLDCEIGAVKKLNSSLISAYPGTSMRVGVEAFSAQAQLADLTVGGAPFATPGYTGGEAQPRIITAATSIQRGQILRYNAKPLGDSGITFDQVVDKALSSLTVAPAGPKYVFLLSDGKTSVERHHADPTDQVGHPPAQLCRRRRRQLQHVGCAREDVPCDRRTLRARHRIRLTSLPS